MRITSDPLVSVEPEGVNPKLVFAVRTSLGLNLGLQFTAGPPSQVVALMIPLAVCLALLILVSVAAGLLIHLVTSVDLATALWMSAPAGLSEIVVLAESNGVPPLPVLTVHLMRVLVIIAVQPSLVLLLARLFS